MCIPNSHCGVYTLASVDSAEVVLIGSSLLRVKGVSSVGGAKGQERHIAIDEFDGGSGETRTVRPRFERAVGTSESEERTGDCDRSGSTKAAF